MQGGQIEFWFTLREIQLMEDPAIFPPPLMEKLQPVQMKTQGLKLPNDTEDTHQMSSCRKLGLYLGRQIGFPVDLTPPVDAQRHKTFQPPIL